MSGLAPAADNTRGAVEQSDSTVVPQNPSLPKLHLNEAQRERIRQTLLTKDTEVEFRLSTTKSAKDFTPKIGGVDTADPGACRLRVFENEGPNSFGE
jgi:hypothetical protein